LEPDWDRKIFDEGRHEADEDKWAVIQGFDLTEGKEKEFKRVFEKEGHVQDVELRYPSRWPKER